MTVELSAHRIPAMVASNVEQELMLPPGVRGYWTDDDLLADAGVGSLPSLKKLQGLGLIHPGHIPIPEGGRRRAWTFREVVRAAAVVEVAAATHMALQAAALLIDHSPREWFETAINFEGILRFLVEGHDERSLDSPPRSRLCVVGMREAFFEVEAGRFKPFAEGMALAGANLNVRRFLGGRLVDEADLTSSSLAVLFINLGRLSLGFVGAVYEARQQRGLLPRPDGGAS